MKKERFIGYLEHMREIAKEHYYSEEVEEVVELLDEIIKKAEQLDEPITTTYPWYPYPYQPWYYTTTWLDSTNNIKLDNQSNVAYNIEYPDPNDWSVTYNEKTPHNFTVVK